MAGDNYFDADAYLRAQNEDLANRVLDANQGGVSPLPDAPAAPAPAEPSIYERFRDKVMLPASLDDGLARIREQNAAQAADQARRLREALSPVASRALSSGLPSTAATLLNAVAPNPMAANAIDKYAASQFPRERAMSFHRDGDNPTLEDIISRADASPYALDKQGYLRMKDASAADPVIKPAPTLKEQAAKALGASAGFGGDAGGLLGKLRGAQQDQVDTMSHGADLALESGQNRATAQTQMADLRAAQAEQMRLDAERQAKIEADANARHEAFLAQSQKMADAISANNVDPSRFLRNADAKTQFVIGLGSAIGGASAAANGGPNQYLDRLDAIMDRDFKGQLANADNQRAALSARNTVFGQVMAQTQDRRLADMQARDLMYTAMKTKLLSDADRLGVPEIMTNARIAANEIENKQKQLQTQIAQQSYQSAVAAAQAAAAQQRAAEERAWQRSLEVMKLNQEQQKIDITAAKEGPGGKDAGERAVVIDGKDALAVNKTAAEKWNEYNHGRAVFAQALTGLKAAREKGDVGAYNAYRATLIEEYPKLLGYTRAPTEGQINHTVGPEAIPEYNHWYNHAWSLGNTYAMQQNRAAEKIRAIDETLSTSDKAMRENTFGANAPTAAGANPSTFKPDAKPKTGAR